MNPIKILIIDNEDFVVKGIFGILKEKFQDQVDIYPKKFDSSELSYNSCNFLIDQVLEKENWEKIYSFYHDIDVLIIDQCLLTVSGDDLGLQFAEFILKKDSFKRIHIISGNDLSKNHILKNRNVRFTGKFIEEYQTQLALMIAEKEKLNLRKTIEDLNEEKLMNLSQQIEMNKKRFIIFIDFIISLLFFVSIIITALVLFIKLISSFVSSFFHGFKNVKTTEILEYSEHIFLYLIPLFILFGFYIYYRNNIKDSFYGRKFFNDGKTNTEEISKNTIKYTKLMFVSSIVSFIIVKIIEFVTSEKKYEIKNIIVLGGLLILLMTYYLILEKKESKEKDKH